jgi:hypothetical protein
VRSRERYDRGCSAFSWAGHEKLFLDLGCCRRTPGTPGPERTWPCGQWCGLCGIAASLSCCCMSTQMAPSSILHA